MFLKSLEIQGFKSFPDKTLLDFSRGITGIVGPNGSGKSNIVDAIRWVMGEQSTRTLRGSRMEDVIFGGTQKRRPVGFCEVTLTIDNSGGGLSIDYADVSITRRLYRSGESEFYINKKAVRLKDVHELLMDTGLGREGYSIIGQGKIDEILSVKSADRREIFEEAAGITKFRYHKEDAEKKLDGTEDNLVRIRDIITELQAQVLPLEHQAEKAKKFLILRDELRILEISSWLDTLESLTEIRQKTQVDFDNAERMLSSERRVLDELYEAAEQIATQMHEKEIQSEHFREELRNMEIEEATVRAETNVLQANFENNENNIERLTAELNQHENREDTLETQRAARQGRLAQIQAELESLKARQTENEGTRTQKEQEFHAKAHAQNELQAKIDEQSRKLHALQTAEAALKSGIEEIEARDRGIIGQLSQAEQSLNDARANAQEIIEAIRDASAREETAKNRIAGFELRTKTRGEKAQKLQVQKGEAEREFHAAKDKASMLKSLEKDHEGFTRATKQVLFAAEKQALSGICGAVSDLISTGDQTAVAIEIALGAALSNIVTTDENSAKAAIAYLKSRDYGRATFLPQTAVKPRSIDAAPLRNQAGFIGVGAELVRFDEKYANVIKSLLGATVIVDSLDNAIAISKKFGYKYRIVTLDGQIINPSGAMTGGSLNKSTGILSRANEIARLEENCNAMQKRIAEIAAEFECANREFILAKNDAQAASAEMQQAQNDLLERGAQQAQHNILLQSLENALGGLISEQSTAGARTQEIRQRLADNAQESQKLAEEINKYKEEFNQGELRQAELRALQSEQMLALAEMAESRAAFEAERLAAQQSLGELDALAEGLKGDREEKKSNIEKLAAQNTEIMQCIALKGETAAQYMQACAQKKELIDACSAEKLQLEARRTKAEKDAQKKNEELLNMERERARLEAKKTQSELQEQQILDKMWENYELTRATAQEIRTQIDNSAETARNIGKLRDEIRKLGSVNIDAIEEYEKVRERYEFLSTQKSDLEKAKTELLDVINNLTQNMQEIFAEQFVKINQNFGETFVEIFGGGSAELLLDDENDILNCGIEIRVELPGKSARAISLLSGGEKAFVAIALYFAILKVRPTPFCVLDEIEAALDDVNVSRYVEYMRTLCEKTQFILITHRRGTMEGSDILYGVTMQEQGVTKLLQMNLQEMEKKLKL